MFFSPHHVSFSFEAREDGSYVTGKKSQNYSEYGLFLLRLPSNFESIMLLSLLTYDAKLILLFDRSVTDRFQLERIGYLQ